MLRRTVFFFLAAVALVWLAVWAVPAAAMNLTSEALEGEAGDAPSASALLADLARAEPDDKIESALRDVLAQAGLLQASDALRRDGALPVEPSSRPEDETYIVVQSAGELDLAPYSEFVHHFRWPAGEHVAVARVRLGDVLAIAGLPGVVSVDTGDPDLMVDRVSPIEFLASADGVAALARHQAIDSAPPWRAEAPTAGDSRHGASTQGVADDPRPDDWFEVGKGHEAQEAWSMGYRGAGVKVGVLDFAVDFSHADLQGTWAVLPEGHTYAGWPQVFDPYSTYLRIVDADLPEGESPSTRLGESGVIELYQTSEVASVEIEGTTAYTMCAQPLVVPADATDDEPTRLLDPTCDFVVPGTSLSGEVRYGHHPDPVLMANGADAEHGIVGEYAGVLLVDEAEAGLYDTVYVDIDGDRDFSDEKPTTKTDPLALRDIDEDGIADLTGGLLYWISDGEQPFPASWVWGLEEDIPPAGRFIGFLRAEGDHGTLCASNIVSQGRLGVPDDQRLEFRDLPDDGRPVSVDLGIAPEAELVSIGSVYHGPSTVIFRSSWRYSVFGHDVDGPEDDIQITSNSYAFSDADNDGWDADSRFLDYYIRTFAPDQSFLTGTGNGGPGYGTNLPPIPSVGMGIAASTQMGSTGAESITDTTQITFGDITPFSNRGPGADGRHGPSVAANGNSGAGAVPINFAPDGAHANGTWGGTSRSGPVAAGSMALVYESYKERTGDWPTWAEARSILMAGARYAGYDVFTEGAGVVDVGDSVRLAAGVHGVQAMPSEWTPGYYRATAYPAFAKLMAPGAQDTTAITLTNPSGEPITVTLSTGTLRRIGSVEDTIITNRLEQSEPSPIPDYVKPLDREQIPVGTELMVARARYPLREFDVDGDYVSDNVVGMGILQHTDINGDGELWYDANGNGVVNHRALTSAAVQFFAGGEWEPELNALESAIAPPLEEAIENELVWFGRGCNDDPVFGDPSGKLALIARGTCFF
ncbi:MAG: S8 family serine peptidase, partial [Anaerolineae bacterium]